MRTAARRLLVGALLLGSGAAAQEAGRRPELAYQLTEGQNINVFVRKGPSAAHMLLRNGSDPRILVAFPAGNSGVGLWFQPVAAPATWTLDAPPQPLTLEDGKGRPLHGVRAVATVAAPRLQVKEAVLSNVRYLRDYQAIAKYPPEVAAKAVASADGLTWARDRLDGAPGYLLRLRVLEGRVEDGAIVAPTNGRIRLEIIAATGDPPLTGLAEGELLNERAAPNPAARNALRFLSYREKFLAGSWRFNTYFGRDTLMSVRLLMPALRPAAIEAGLNSVLARLNAAGEVAHEEGIGEFAIMERRRASERGNAPDLDYFMVDDDYMLAPVAASYLLDRSPREQARAYLARSIPSETGQGGTVRVGEAMVRNLRFVVAQAQPFADRPEWSRLIAFKPGRPAGQWRDSHEGVGGGRYAYDVNAVFVPAALDAARRMLAAGLLDPYLTDADRAALGQAASAAQVWRTRAPALFRVSHPAAAATPAIRGYARTLGVPAEPGLQALGRGPLTFHAIALDERGRPVPIIHSDESFDLLFGEPSAADLDTYVGAMMRPFPAGLMTPIGLLVANPALAGDALQAQFTPAQYHGAVVWSWQQALLAAGLERQLERRDLPAATRARLERAQAELWRAIESARAVANSELWSWAYAQGRYQVVPFGAGRKDVDESNAAQLWSTVYLAVQPPGATTLPEKR
ncbi:hypothetical protein [Sphingomonas lenta]|uniref:Lipoprotein n=1 Tax=Sphingomonas lenta TaxID=1141887 RepID=A0A2A2SGD0_9SPHN|nr:hypothetical protein [Sphingomonas lenta]PAX08316.1 hypothetical protein CKY28_08155 [Sphingomonas lenta]